MRITAPLSGIPSSGYMGLKETSRFLTIFRAKFPSCTEINPNQLTSAEYAEWRKAFAFDRLLPDYLETAQRIQPPLDVSHARPVLSFASVSDKPILRAKPLTKFSFFKSTYEPETTSDGDAFKRMVAEFHDIGRTVPAKIRDGRQNFSFFRAVTGSAPPFQPGTDKQPHRRRQAHSVSGSRSASPSGKHPTDLWLQKLNSDLDTLIQPIKLSREKLEKISSPYFRNRLSFQLTMPPEPTKKRCCSSIYHSPKSGIIFSSVPLLDSLISDSKSEKSITQSKTTFAFPEMNVSSTQNVAKNTKNIPVNAEENFKNVSALTVFQKRREERMQRLTRKMFSLSRDAAIVAPPIKTSQFGLVKKLSQKYETWQRVRSASSDSRKHGQRNPKQFSYTDAGALDIWSRKGVSASKSLPDMAPVKEIGGLVKSKSGLPAATCTRTPYRHVGFELLESSLSLDDKMTSVSSFTDSGLDYFRRGSSVSSLSSSENGHYQDYFFTGPCCNTIITTNKRGKNHERSRRLLMSFGWRFFIHRSWILFLSSFRWFIVFR